MIAAAFAYNNYRFSKFKFIDFSQYYLYERADIFTPDKMSYKLLFYSSNQNKLKDIIAKGGIELDENQPVLAIDIAQKRGDTGLGLIQLSSDINTILKILSTFNITDLPASVVIERDRASIYKQSSKIDKI
ncbi:hypothetical protein [Campylobacter sp. 19-13652]|uniref:hypothetical protein n=1 Tax=Campylobacter sp. 19-13652 TaxID=2840180 RepID=UPI001C758947|nr:hypothetical protein [Campylobacter sp. 19-13652]BCX80108.1 hypothetical protein LBC_15700 [Campylobacter sp. 19-13652]